MTDKENTNRILSLLQGKKKRGSKPAGSGVAENPETSTSTPSLQAKSRPVISGDIAHPNRATIPQNATSENQNDAPSDEASDIGVGETGRVAPAETDEISRPNQQAAEAMAQKPNSDDYNPNPVPGARAKAPEQKAQGQGQPTAAAAKGTPQELANQKPGAGVVGRTRNRVGSAINSVRNRGNAGTPTSAKGGDENEGQTKKGAGEKVADTAQKAKDVVDWAQKGARALAGDVSAMGQLLLKGFKNPKTRWLLIAFLASTIVLITLGIAVAISFLAGLNGMPNAVTGHDQPQLVNPSIKGDQDVIKQTLALAGDRTASTEIIDNGLDKIQQNMLTLKDQYSTNTDSVSVDIVNKIGLVSNSIDTLKATKNPANAKTFLTQLTNLDNEIEDTFPVFHQGDATFPTKSPVLTKNLVFNATLHGGSKMRPEHVDNHGVFTAYDKGTCDAVDVSADADSLIYPIFAGTVAAVGTDGSDGQRIVIQNGDYRMVYAHLLDVPFSKGAEVRIDQSIGKVKKDHVQLEAIFQRMCLTTTFGDLLDHSKAKPKNENLGGYLWDRIVEKFHISM